jgi:hypothetical protein
MRSTLTKLLFLLILGASVSQAYAQSDSTRRYRDTGEPWELKDRIFYGGNFSLQLGNVTFIDVSPYVGYRLTPQFQAGVGATYQYLSYRNFGGGLRLNSSVYGGRGFLRYFVLPPRFFLHTEYEQLNLYRINQLTGEGNRQWIPAYFVGGGYSQLIGNRSAFNITILYNLIWDARSAYASPWVVRAGFQL